MIKKNNSQITDIALSGKKDSIIIEKNNKNEKDSNKENIKKEDSDNFNGIININLKIYQN
jgi:hypothetical protein